MPKGSTVVWRNGYIWTCLYPYLWSITSYVELSTLCDCCDWQIIKAHKIKASWCDFVIARKKPLLRLLETSLRHPSLRPQRTMQCSLWAHWAPLNARCFAKVIWNQLLTTSRQTCCSNGTTALLSDEYSTVLPENQKGLQSYVQSLI